MCGLKLWDVTKCLVDALVAEEAGEDAVVGGEAGERDPGVVGNAEGFALVVGEFIGSTAMLGEEKREMEELVLGLLA